MRVGDSLNNHATGADLWAHGPSRHQGMRIWHEPITDYGMIRDFHPRLKHFQHELTRKAVRGGGMEPDRMSGLRGLGLQGFRVCHHVTGRTHHPHGSPCCEAR